MIYFSSSFYNKCFGIGSKKSIYQNSQPDFERKITKRGTYLPKVSTKLWLDTNSSTSSTPGSRRSLVRPFHEPFRGVTRLAEVDTVVAGDDLL